MFVMYSRGFNKYAQFTENTFYDKLMIRIPLYFDFFITTVVKNYRFIYITYSTKIYLIVHLIFKKQSHTNILILLFKNLKKY